MHILKYLLSKSYRRKFDAKFTKELFDRFFSEQKKKQEICKTIFGNKANL